MTCVICKSGTPEAGKTTVTLERGKALIVFRRVPAKFAPTVGRVISTTAWSLKCTMPLIRLLKRAWKSMCANFITSRRSG